MGAPQLFVILFLLMFTFVRFWKTGLISILRQKIVLLTASGKDNEFIRIATVLEKQSRYFNSLSDSGKEKFIKRCILFADSRSFIGMHGMVITDDVKLKLAVAAVQITFGFKNFSFSHYHTFKIFPNEFYSRMHNGYLKGGTSTGGIMYFSWQDFIEGYANSSDRYNLGLHEMAHALRLQLLHGSDFDERFANYADNWEEIARPEFEAMRQKEGSFLRSYAAVNIEEFFAVCVEHFFEVPHEFHQNLPDIYNHLCFLLNQDPERGVDDYRLSPQFIQDVNADHKLTPIPLKIKKKEK